MRGQPSKQAAAALSSRKQCAALDQADPLREVRRRFHLPKGLLYLDGNSLGAMPKAVVKRLDRTRDVEWAEGLIGSWNGAGWFRLPAVIGDKIARLIGAPAGSVIAGDTISINLFKLLGAALKLRPDRRVILTDTGNFPSDLYVAQGLIDLLGQGYQLRCVEPKAIAANLDDSIAVLTMTEVDYRTGEIHDMRALTRKAHAVGALGVWDLSHSGGVLPVDLTGARADMAVGCTYKYLNGGPGAPSFLYVRPEHQANITSPLAGWWGHARPLDFTLGYEPADGIIRMQCGTQSMLSMAALDTALDVWQDLSMADVRQKSMALTSLFVDLVEAKCDGHGLELASPRKAELRGAQISFRCPNAYAVMQALIADGVIGDFRAPDFIRFGFAPLYVRYVDVWDAVVRLARILNQRRWDKPQFKVRRTMT